jgi:hypothetical protein
MAIGEDLMGGPPPTFLPAEPGAGEELAGGSDPYEVAGRHPTSSLAWAVLADAAWNDGRAVESYAFARVGYHRGLDALRRNGWKGHGPVPWSHEPNRGWLRCLHALARGAHAINETDEAKRCSDFLRDSSPEAAAELEGR